MSNKYPADIHLYGERDFTLLSSFLLARQFVKGISKKLGYGYKICVILYKDKKMGIYRSLSNEEEFSNYYGDKFIKFPALVDEMVDRLYCLTDEVSVFLKNEPCLSLKNYKSFFDLFDEHFVYHLAMFWAGEHLLSVKGEKDPTYIRVYEVRKHNEKVLPEIENWLNTQGDICFMTPDEIENLFVNEVKLSDDEISARKKIAFIFGDRDNLYLISGQKALEEFSELDAIVSNNNKKIIGESNEVKGTPAYPGMYRGKARIINDFAKFSEIKEGEVLFAPMTRPHFNEDIRRAGAIVTDEGAILCHAAIIAREFKIPCIIGTKVGTFMFKDGDIVEVDADRGIVKILK